MNNNDSNGTATMTEIFGEPISIYTRAQAIEDGVLVDLTEWASESKGFHGGFKCSVAVTSALWADIERLPKSGFQDVRGRAHDVLWMASLAFRGMMKRSDTNPVLYRLSLRVGRTTRYVVKLVMGPDENGAPTITLMKRDED